MLDYLVGRRFFTEGEWKEPGDIIPGTTAKHWPKLRQLVNARILEPIPGGYAPSLRDTEENISVVAAVGVTLPEDTQFVLVDPNDVQPVAEESAVERMARQRAEAAEVVFQGSVKAVPRKK